MAVETIPAVEIKNLSRNFGTFEALNNLSLVVEPGETLAVFGHNGAGKTTLLKILSTVMKPTRGNIYYSGLSIAEGAENVRRRLGVVSHRTFLYSSLTAYDNLVFYSRLYDVAGYETRIKQLLNRLGLRSRMYDKVGTFSRGMSQRLAIARALLHHPEVVLMDEPESGLDTFAMDALWQLVREDSRTVIFTHHNLERGFQAASRVVIMARGKMFFCPGVKCSFDELEKAYKASLETA
ncbi:MAG: ABC transporter ATP-binding protein [Dehalococcoidaceae bacterium]|nr:ABC transporter ATP-binding protein [Dehalococcoidaceae bacterium]